MNDELLSAKTASDIELRTSSNNMMCVVTYEPITEEEQSELNEILQVAN
jgi:hypothetical protein